MEQLYQIIGTIVFWGALSIGGYFILRLLFEFLLILAEKIFIPAISLRIAQARYDKQCEDSEVKKHLFFAGLSMGKKSRFGIGIIYTKRLVWDTNIFDWVKPKEDEKELTPRELEEGKKIKSEEDE